MEDQNSKIPGVGAVGCGDGSRKSCCSSTENCCTNSEISTMTDEEARKILEENPFMSLVVSLTNSAYVSLGLIPNPLSTEGEINLRDARYSMDVLEMLRKKTVNNLNDDEENMLDTLLGELRMKYDGVSKSMESSS